MKYLFYTLFLLILISSLAAQSQNYAYRLTIESYRSLYGKNEPSLKLINFFDKKRKNANIYFGIAGGIGSVAAYIRSPIVAIPCIPLLGIGISRRMIYSKRKLYHYLIKEKDITVKLQQKIDAKN